MTKQHPMALRAGDLANFKVLEHACRNSRLALISAIRKSDRAKVALVCGMNRIADGSIIPVPLAVMVEGNPYALFEDPTQES